MKNATWYGSCLALPLLGALGCSDPVPPPPEGSVSMHVGTSPTPTTGFSCPLNATYAAGAPAPDTTTTGTPLIDGQNGASIACSIKGAGSFAFSGSLSEPATTSGMGAVATIRLAFAGALLAGGMPTYVHGTVYTSELTDTIVTQDTTDPALQPAQMCTFEVLGNQIKPGAVWASFSCPHMQASPSIECGVNGEVVFQDCDGA